MTYYHDWKTLLNPGKTKDFFRDIHPPRFVVEKNGFSPVNAWWLSELSRLIYLQDHTEGVAGGFSRNDYLQRVGLEETDFLSTPAVQCALIQTKTDDLDAFAAIVFRGTTGHLTNWWINLDIRLSPWPNGGCVHRGFKSILLPMWGAIESLLQRINRPVYFTGHSLGGALAILAASLRPPRAVYAFGSPRCGDAAFAQIVSSIPVFNVINPKDVVTTLPPTGRGALFTHAGMVIRNRPVSFPHRLLSQAPEFLADHAPANYSAHLSQTLSN